MTADRLKQREYNALDFYRNAFNLFGNERYNEAIEYSRKSLEESASGEAMAMIAMCFLKLSEEEQAKTVFRSALPFGIRDINTYELFLRHFEFKDVVFYEEVLRYGLLQHPNCSSFYYRIWRLLISQTRHKELLPLMRTLVEFAPEGSNYHALAVVCRYAYKYEEGIAAANKAIELGYCIGNVFSNLGQLLYAVNRFQDAANAFEAAAIAPEPDISMSQYLVNSLRISGNAEKAHQWQRHFVQMGFCVGGLTPFGEDFSGLERMAEESPGFIARNKWYKSTDLRRFPSFAQLPDLKQIVQEFVLSDYPSHNIFSSDSKIITFGSCFASEIRKAFQSRNIRSSSLAIPEGLNNTFAIRSFIEWCLLGKRESPSYWYDNSPELGAFEWESKEESSLYAEILRGVDAIILTIGLAEVWRDRKSKGVFWRGVPRHIYDESRHEVVLSTPEENEQNILAIIELIRKFCGNKHIIITVSPVPLNATFRNIPCVIADADSKAIIRSSVALIMNRHYPLVYYWPSFEIVRWLGSHIDRSTFRTDSGRHVRQEVIDIIVESFMEKFFVQGST